MTSPVPLDQIVTHLDELLRIREVPDEANAVNGLQVENASGTVGRVVAAVDASLASIAAVVAEEKAAGRQGGRADRADKADRADRADKADRTDKADGAAGRQGGKADRADRAERTDMTEREDEAAGRHGGKTGGGTLLLVHHGLFWDGNVPATGRRYRRLRTLFDHDIAVYSAHIPLDIHPEVGNNALLAQQLGVVGAEAFTTYRGIPFGASGVLELAREELVARLVELLGANVSLIPGGPERTRNVGIITGGAGTSVGAAHAAGLDTFITGEGPHHTYHDAMELGVNLIYAGHYATETVGVKALAEAVGELFGVPWEFQHQPTGL